MRRRGRARSPIQQGAPRESRSALEVPAPQLRALGVGLPTPDLGGHVQVLNGNLDSAQSRAPCPAGPRFRVQMRVQGVPRPPSPLANWLQIQGPLF